MINTKDQEQERLVLQSSLDKKKSQLERNRLGQFATPSALAEDIIHYAMSLLPPDTHIHFLDPAIGTGSFYSALLKIIPNDRISEALGFEIDPYYGKPAAQLWENTNLVLKIADFTQADPSPRFNLLICNPPYVRHHHLKNGEKSRLQQSTQKASGMKNNGLAGLYCYFLGLAHSWMAEGGIAGWLIPSEFMDVNYGQAVKWYLLNRVTLLHIHRFDPNDVQFSDALVSSTVVWLKKETPPPDHQVKFSYGGTLIEPKITRYISAHALVKEPKWTRFPAADVRSRNNPQRLSDFFQIKRGIATGDNKFFILSEAEITKRNLPMEVFTPILPSPRYLSQDKIEAREDGSPDIVNPLYLLNTKLSEDVIQNRYPSLFAYIEEGKARGINEGYLCKHRTRWYEQEDRPPAPIVCTYLGRGCTKKGRPFRFILNKSSATAANVYLLLYPTPFLSSEIVRDSTLVQRIWYALNNLSSDVLLDEGRVYGGGLYKLEPRELGNVPATFMLDLLTNTKTPVKAIQPDLFDFV